MSAPDIITPAPVGGGTPVGGSGTSSPSTIPRWTGASTLGDSGLIDNGTAIYTTTRNVGIGTASPLARLAISTTGNVNAPTLGSATGTPLLISNSNTTFGLVVGTNGADGHAWLQAQRTDATATAYNITLNEAGGNVGIGTASPVSRLTSLYTGQGAGASNGVFYDNSTYTFRVGYAVSTDRNLNLRAGTGYNPSITFTEEGVSDRWAIGTKSGDASFYFSTGSSLAGGSVKATIDGTGNVGIGTASPSAKLHVSNATDPAVGVLFNGITKAVRIGFASSESLIEGTDNTGVGSFQQLTLRGSFLNFAAGSTKYAQVAPGAFDISLVSGYGLKLPATPGATGAGTEQILDCYNEGTWTPTLTGFGGTNPTLTARYVRVGKLVTLSVLVSATGGATFSSTAATTYISLPAGMTPTVCSQPGATSNSGIGADGPCVAYTNGNLYLPTFALRTADTFLNVTYML